MKCHDSIICILYNSIICIALEQRAVEQTVRPHESTAEIVGSSLPTQGQLSYEGIVTRIFNLIGDARFLGDIISIIGS